MPFEEPISAEHLRKQNVQAIIYAGPNLKMIAVWVFKVNIIYLFLDSSCDTKYDNSYNHTFLVNIYF